MNIFQRTEGNVDDVQWRRCCIVIRTQLTAVDLRDRAFGLAVRKDSGESDSDWTPTKFGLEFRHEKLEGMPNFRFSSLLCSTNQVCVVY